MKTDDPVLIATQLEKSFREGDNQLQVLKGISMQVARGKRVAIVGLSGSGKSTLLHLLGGLDRPDAGEVLLAGKSMSSSDDAAICRMRNQYLGFVYQFHHLLSDFDAIENVAMPLLIRGLSRRAALGSAAEMLERVGLQDRGDHKPGQLSGGERQRVALARALVTTPLCVLADEPTGNLDEKTAAHINELLIELSQSLDISFVIVTHNNELAQSMDEILTLHDGRLVHQQG